MDLVICTNDEPSCLVYARPNAITGLMLHVWAPVSPNVIVAEFCSVSALSVGSCLAGKHTVQFQAYRNGAAASDQATLTVSLGTPILSFAVNITAQLDFHPGNVSRVLTALKEELSGGSSLTNWLLHDASDALKSAVRAPVCRGTLAIDALDVYIRTANAALLTQPSANTLQVRLRSGRNDSYAQ
jgi:hypothetical protein